MKVEIWSDLVCPWCGLGSHRLAKAVERFAHRDEVEVIHRSFQLDPSFPSGSTMPVREQLTRVHGMGDAQAEAVTGRLEEMAERDGLTPYVVLDNRIGNTALAHELLAHATAEGKNAEAWHHLFRAHFGEKRSIFGLDPLLELADELGLDRASTRSALTDHRHRQQVQDEVREAQRLGARGAPFFVFAGKYAVSGAQEIDTMLDVLEQVWNETHPSLVPTGTCGPHGCALPEHDHADR
jgi:predicted DsbA family dithiol-disulfide isomerase